MPAAKGHPRWGGRRKGTPNKVTADFRDLVRDDTKDFSVLRRLATGLKIADHRPTIDQILRTNEILIGKVAPSQKSSEIRADVQSYQIDGVSRARELLEEITEQGREG